MVGGGSNSCLCAQIHADTLNKKIIINNIKDATILGSALLAGTATGEINKVVDDEQIIKQDNIFVPIKKNRQIYNELYNKFNEYLKKNYTNE
jgi:sugar (pentulose or hexulose) kinase